MRESLVVPVTNSCAGAKQSVLASIRGGVSHTRDSVATALPIIRQYQCQPAQADVLVSIFTSSRNITNEQVLCRCIRFPPRPHHLPNPHSSATDATLWVPCNSIGFYHLHFIRDYADLFGLEGILLSSLEP